MADLQSNPAASGREMSARFGTAGWRRWTLRALAVLVGTLVPLGCLEVLLRTLPVYGGTRTLPVNEENPVIRLEPNREFVWSRDWNFSIVNDVRVNNFGFVSDVDYDPHAAGPLLAVIGDSYVEALMVPFRRTCTGRLASALNGTARVYAFGASGSALSQYLAFAEYARDTFRPDGLAVVVIANDYDESLVKYGHAAGKHQFVERRDGRLVLERNDFAVGPFHRLVRASALMRYMVGNLDAIGWMNEATRRQPDAGADEGMQWFIRSESGARGELDQAEPAEPGHAEREPSRETDSKRAVDAFLDRLPAASGLDPARIVFVVDGMRPQLYRDGGLERAAGSFPAVMRRYFLASASGSGYETIDLQPAFATHYDVHGERFEWPQDSHWNALGHELCFNVVTRSEVLGRLAGQVESSDGAADRTFHDSQAGDSQVHQGRTAARQRRGLASLGRRQSRLRGEAVQSGTCSGRVIVRRARSDEEGCHGGPSTGRRRK